MAKAGIRVVSDASLERLWRENGMPEKRAAGVFIEIVAHIDPPNEPTLRGVAVSAYVKLITAKGHQIGTVHEVRFTDGSNRPPVHAHPKDYVMRDCTVVRAVQKGDLLPPKRLRRKRVEIWDPFVSDQEV